MAKSKAHREFLRLLSGPGGVARVAESFLIVLARDHFCEKRPGSLAESIRAYQDMWWWSYGKSVIGDGGYKPIFWRANALPVPVEFDRLSSVIEMAILRQDGHVDASDIAQSVARDPEFWRVVRGDVASGDRRFIEACLHKGIDTTPPIDFAHLGLDMKKHCPVCGCLGWDIELGVCAHCGEETEILVPKMKPSGPDGLLPRGRTDQSGTEEGVDPGLFPVT